MIINKDTIQFEAQDIAQFSAELQEGFTTYNTKFSPEALLSNTVNHLLKTVKQSRITAIQKDLNKVAVALVDADPAAKAEVQNCIDLAKAALGIQDPAEIVEEPAGLLDRVKGFFGIGG